MSSDDKVGEYLEHGPASSDADVPDSAVHARRTLGSPSVWGDPAPGGLDGVLDRINTERSPAVAPKRRRLMIVAAAAVVLVFVGGLAGWLVGEWAPTVGSQRTELAGTEFAPGASAVALIKEKPGGVAVTLDVSGLPPAAPGTYYEGWVKSEDDVRVSLGTFHMRGGGDDIELWAGVDLARYSLITVTIQPEQAGERPPGKVVLRGPIPAQ